MRTLLARTFLARTFRARTLHGPVAVVAPSDTTPTAQPGVGGTGDGYRETRKRTGHVEYEDVLYKAYERDVEPPPQAEERPAPVAPALPPLKIDNRLADVFKRIDAEREEALAALTLESRLREVGEAKAMRALEAQEAAEDEEAALSILMAMV